MSRQWKLGRVMAKKQPQMVKIPPHMRSRKKREPRNPVPSFFRAKSGKILKILQRLGFWKSPQIVKKNTEKYQ